MHGALFSFAWSALGNTPKKLSKVYLQTNKNGSALILLWYSCSMIVRHKMACLYCLSFTFTTKTTIALISWMLLPVYYNVKNKISCNQTFNCPVQLVVCSPAVTVIDGSSLQVSSSFEFSSVKGSAAEFPIALIIKVVLKWKNLRSQDWQGSDNWEPALHRPVQGRTALTQKSTALK